jgi:hypothetical protein
MIQFDRHIFTDRKPSRLSVILDYALALTIAGCLTMAALAYFDVLFV